MENFEAELQRRVDEAVAANDLATLDRLLRTLYEKADEADRPLDAAIQLRPEFSEKIGKEGSKATSPSPGPIGSLAQSDGSSIG
jgi:hypothetical protein